MQLSKLKFKIEKDKNKYYNNSFLGYVLLNVYNAHYYDRGFSYSNNCLLLSNVPIINFISLPLRLQSHLMLNEDVVQYGGHAKPVEGLALKCHGRNTPIGFWRH